MKRILTAILLCAVSVSLFACGSKSEDKGQATNKDVALSTVVDAIKEAYGEEYLPNMLVEEENIEAFYGLSKDMYEEVYAEVPMISANIDTLIAVKVADGKQQAVVDALNKYRDVLLNDTLQYPMNALKLQSSRVIEKDGFVFFVSLGVIPMEIEEENEVIEAAAKNNDIAQQAIDSVLK